MKRPAPTRRAAGRLIGDRRGVSIIETVVSIVVLTTAVLAVAAASGWANRATATARRDLHWWAALQWKADSLMGLSASTIQDGQDVVNGFPISWTKHAGTSTRIELVIEGRSSLGERVIADTVSLYLGS